ncbi:DUF2262 domain-containing protein [Bacillus infantis]|uniref:DUF2262 domain-containing protein n=1 Tax=Bacillus infantis TaxID=324767 RepID=UPI0020044875|nr:DUF2262 domain-containing protein [Bacillus infantis]
MKQLLNFDSERKEYTGKIDLNNKFIDITVTIEEFNEDDVFRKVENTFDKIIQHEEMIKEGISEELLNLHNDTWNEGKIISTSEFISRIQLEGILFFCEGNAELYYNDGDLFWGHTIAANISEEGQFESAHIYG